MTHQSNMRLLNMACLLIINVMVAFSMPARPGMHRVVQPDGSTVTAELRGDEHFSYYVTPDGYPLLVDESGFLVYAAEGMRVSAQRAHDIGSRDAREMNYIAAIDVENVMKGISERRKTSRRHTPQRSGVFPSTGEVRGLVILAEFADCPFSSGSIRTDIERMMNEENYSEGGATGSARDYFIDQSNGKFLPVFDVAGPVRLPHEMSFYGAHDVYEGVDRDPAQMVVDACKGVSGEVDFSQYDLDENGEVDLVFIIYSGYSEAQGGDRNSIWPHAWDIKSGGKILRLNGVSIGRYACTAELRGNSGSELDGIGTFCHEFSHCLGLPDIYDVEYSGFVGLGAWDVMDAGGYNNLSRTPAGYTAYEKEFCGWMKIKTLDAPQNGVSLRNIAEYPEAVKIVSQHNPDEYFTLENRQNTGWDAHIPGHGLVITHVDYDPGVWADNIVNTKRGGHPHLQIIAADKNFSTLEGAAFPGLSGNTDFSHFSDPAMTLWNGDIKAPVTDIRETDGVVCFNFNTWIAAPFARAAENIDDTSFVANWDHADGAEYYRISINSVNSGLLVDSPVTETVTINSGENLDTPYYPFDRHHTFTIHVNLKGNRTLMNGLEMALITKDGKVLASKRFTLRDYERDEYWVVQATAEAMLQLRASDLIEVNSIDIYNGNVEADLRIGNVPEPSSYRFTKIIERAESSPMAIDGLDAGREYIYNVVAVNDSFNSESLPSNKVSFNTTGLPGSATAPVMPGVTCNAYGEKGAIRYSCPANARIMVFDLQGHLVVSAEARGEQGAIEGLLPGIYLTSIGSEKFKCAVK